MALISLDDLEGLDKEHLDDDITEPEPMEEEERARLLRHWQAVASTHQVSVPAEMTRNSQQREPLPFALISHHERMGEVLFEERLYPARNRASVTRGEVLYEQSISTAFMKLMRFICKENSAGRYLGMTVPVVSALRMAKDSEAFEKDVEAPRSFDPEVSQSES